MPRGEHPGALDAETPAFLDFLIGHSPAVRGTFYKTGLLWLDGQAKLKFREAVRRSVRRRSGTSFLKALVANVDDPITRRRNRTPKLCKHCARGYSYGDDEFQTVAGFAG